MDTVNAQITDSVTQVNTKVVGETPAMAMGNLLISQPSDLDGDTDDILSPEE